MKNIQGFLVEKDELIIVLPKEAKLITYKYNFGKPIEGNDIEIYNGCIIFSVGERKNSLPTLNFCKKIGTHIKSHV